MLERAARQFPNKDAIVTVTRRYSYEDFLDLSKRAAAVFRDVGVEPGQRVGVMTYNTPAFMIAAFGLWRAGAVLVPVNHKLTARELAYIAEHAELKAIVADTEFAERVSEADGRLRLLATTDAGDGEFDRLVQSAVAWNGVPVTGDMIAEVLYTSGTTSDPKGCEHNHAGLYAVPGHTTAAVGMRKDDRFLIAMPIWHATLLNNWMLSMVYLGGTVVLLKEYHPVEFLKTVEAEKVTAFFGAPIAYLAPLQVLPTIGKTINDFDLSTARLWIYGGAPMGAETMKTLQAAYQSDSFSQVYGMSETGPVGSALYPEEQVIKAGSIGAGGMPGVEIRVVRDDGEAAQAEEVGEIVMRSNTRMVGYLKSPKATAEVFDGDWYRTGDLARVDSDGYLYIVDRVKDVVITGGENVFSPEIEEMLLQHPAVADAAVIGRPHPEWGETIVAVVVASEPLELDGVREFLANRLAKYKIPRELVVRDDLPRTPSGKIKKHMLRAEIFG